MPTSSAFSPDLVLHGGRLLVMDRANSTVQALAIKDGRIVATGDDEDILRLAGQATEVVDLRGRVAIPGLTDAHVHLATDAARGAEAIECRDLYETDIEAVADIQTRLKEATQSVPPGTWIMARGSPMQEFRLKERRFINRAEMDAATPAHPTVITFGAHITVANSLALKERGITAATEAPKGGTILKDAAGEPTGVFLERAQYLLRSKSVSMSPEDLAEHILIEFERTAKRGVTGVHDIVISKDEVQAYQLLQRSGRLPVRVQMILRVIESTFDKNSLLDLGLLHGFGSDYLRIGGIKLSVDGGFTGKNAAFSEPLELAGGEKGHGMIRIQKDELEETIEAYHRAGMRICTHAMGDAAVDMVLDAYEKALTTFPRSDHRHRVEHMANWAFTPERIARTKRLGIVPMPNPAFLYYFGDPSIDMLGPRMTRHGFPFRSMLEAGVPYTFGSDAPGYFPVDPLRDVGTAVAHQTLSGATVNAHETLTVVQALRVQTAGAAFVGFVEDRLGTLEVGKLADVTVLGEDPFSYPPEQFDRLPIDLTVVGGQVTHSRMREAALA